MSSGNALISAIREMRFAESSDPDLPGMDPLRLRVVALHLADFFQEMRINPSIRTMALNLSTPLGQEVEIAVRCHSVLVRYLYVEGSIVCLSRAYSSAEWDSIIDDMLLAFPIERPLCG